MTEAELKGRGAIRRILLDFPHLQYSEQEGLNVQYQVTLPVQTGLAHETWLAFDNEDELLLGVGHFHSHWYPSHDDTVSKDYAKAAEGFLAGINRIVEHYAGNRCIRAELQAPDVEGWQTIQTWGLIWFPLPWTKRRDNVIRNCQEA